MLGFHLRYLSILHRINNFDLCLSTSSKFLNRRAYSRVIFSGIQPTGHVHLGNYLGAIRQWLHLVRSGDCDNLTNTSMFISIVDLHSLTNPQRNRSLPDDVMRMTAMLLACGLDSTHVTLFLQSQIPYHTELAWILACLTSTSRLSHLTQYRQFNSAGKTTPLGVFLYPVLQAADILLYRATDVPVGEDQSQHIEFVRYLIKAFNRNYGNVFPDIRSLIPDKQAARIRSLRDPNQKMSKSDPDKLSCIYLDDCNDTIRRKCRMALSDHISTIVYDPENRPAVSNLMCLHSAVTGKDLHEVERLASFCDTLQYKELLAESIIALVEPIRNRFIAYHRDTAYLRQMLEQGRLVALDRAESTWKHVREVVGLQLTQDCTLDKRGLGRSI